MYSYPVTMNHMKLNTNLSMSFKPFNGVSDPFSQISYADGNMEIFTIPIFIIHGRVKLSNGNIFLPITFLERDDDMKFWLTLISILALTIVITVLLPPIGSKNKRIELSIEIHDCQYQKVNQATVQIFYLKSFGILGKNIRAVPGTLIITKSPDNRTLQAGGVLSSDHSGSIKSTLLLPAYANVVLMDIWKRGYYSKTEIIHVGDRRKINCDVVMTAEAYEPIN